MHFTVADKSTVEWLALSHWFGAIANDLGLMA
jgi:hypothetical protein